MVDLARTVSSSTLAGDSAAAAASPAHNQTNDALEPARSPSLLLSPSAALLKLAPETHASDTFLDVATAPTTAPTAPSSALTKKISISGDEARLVQGVYRKPTDATPLPDPLFHPYADMKNKPGATHTLKFTDTLLDSGPHPPPARKVYGHAPYRQSLFREESTGPIAIWQSPEGSPAKKRKTAKDDTRQTIEQITISEDEDRQDIRPHSRVSPRPISRHSAESGHQNPKSPTSLRRSEFEMVARRVEPPRSKRSRKANGNTKASCIVLDEEESARRSETPDELLCSPPRNGISNRDDSTQGLGSVVKSHHFAKPKPKMNHSTYPPRETIDHAPRKTQYGSSKSDENAHRLDEILSEDELSAAPGVKQSTKGCWPLLFARAPGYQEETTRMYLEKLRPNEYVIKSPTSDFNAKLKGKFFLYFSKINDGYADEVSRIRLMGGLAMQMKQSHSRYMVDLQFASKEHLHAFSTEVRRSITAIRLGKRDPEFMETVFKKAFSAKTSATTHEASSRVELQSAPNDTPRSRLIPNLAESHDKRVKPESTGHPETTRELAQNRSVLNRPVRTTRATHPINVAVEEEPEEERYSVVHGLGKPWKKPLQYGSGRRSTMVDFSDLERLDNGQYLNDQIIEFYLLYLFNELSVSHDKVYMFNTHFFTSLTRKVPGQKANINYQAVAKWTSKVDIFGYDYIIVPINQDSHWYLAIICNVSNISRIPAIDDPNRSRILGAESSDCPKSDSILGEEGATDKAPESTPISAPNGQSAQDQHLRTEENDEGLDLIDINAPKPVLSVENSFNAQTPTVAIAKLQNSSTEPKPRGILLDTGSPVVSPKKKKRKNAAPPRKWDVEKPVIIVLDSLGHSARSNTVRALKDYIREEGHHKRGMEAEIKQNAFYAKDTQIPMQDNFFDCGVYLLGYAQKFFEDPDRFKQRLLTGEMQLETDWPDMAMPKMRDKMREILLDLGRAQDEELKKARSLKKRSVDGSAKPALESKPVPEEAVKNDAERSPQNGDSTQSDTSDSSTAKPSEAEQPTASLNLGPSSLGPSILGPRAVPPPRLGSPFEPKPFVIKREVKETPASTMSNKAVSPRQIPEVELGRLMNGNPQQSSATLVPRRNKSPVVIPDKSPVSGNSSKRPLPLDEDSTDIPTSDTVEAVTSSSPKKPKLEASATHKVGSQKMSASNGRLPVSKAQSPTTIQRSKASRMGSSQEPIEIDSQELAVASPKKLSKEVHDLDQDPDDIILMSPRSASETTQSQQSRNLGNQQQVRRQIAARPTRRQSPTVQIKPRSAQTSPSTVRNRDPQQPRSLQGTHIIRDSFTSPAPRPRSRGKRIDPDIVTIPDDDEIAESPPSKRSSPLAPAIQNEIQLEDSMINELQ